jgi:hypothetical protein
LTPDLLEVTKFSGMELPLEVNGKKYKLSNKIEVIL